MKGRPQPLRYLILSDLHIPNHDQRSLAAVEKFMASRKRDGLVYIGDVGNFDVISSHNLGKLRLVEGERLRAEYKAIDEVITRHERIMRKNDPNARIVWLEGNHCYRVTRYLDAHPELEGLLEIPTILKLKERNIEWIPSWSEGKTLKLGKLKLHHGFYACDHAAKKMLQNFGMNICFGHTHTVQEYYSHNVDYNQAKVGVSIGCLCNRPKYLNGPSRWQQAFMIVDVDKRNGNFWYNIIRICDHKFIFDGIVYE